MSGSRAWIAAAGFLTLTLTLIVPSARGQAVAFAPGVSSFPNGVIMSATPAVSFDRRYVRLGMLPQFTAIEGFDTLLVPAAVSGVGGVGAGGLGGGGGAGGGGGLMGFAGMNGPMARPPAQGSFPQGGWNGGRDSGGSSDFEDQLRPSAPARQVAARPAPAAKAKRKVATARPGRTSRPARPATRAGQPR